MPPTAPASDLHGLAWVPRPCCPHTARPPSRALYQGTISRDEFLAIMERHTHAVPSGADLDSAFRAMDVQGTGEIEWRWFLAAALRAAPAHTVGSPDATESSRASDQASGSAGGPSPLLSAGPTLVDTFLLLDRNRDNFVDAHDLLELFAGSDDLALRQLSEADVRGMLREAMGGPTGETGHGGGNGGDDEGDPIYGNGGDDEGAIRLSLDDFRALLLGPSPSRAALAQRIHIARQSSQLQLPASSAIAAEADVAGAVGTPADAPPPKTVDKSRVAASKRDVVRMFRRAEADEEKAGRLSEADLLEWAARHFGEDVHGQSTAAWVEALVLKYDRDEDGRLDKDEFGFAMREILRTVHGMQISRVAEVGDS